jgi:hypothetical protein
LNFDQFIDLLLQLCGYQGVLSHHGLFGLKQDAILSLQLLDDLTVCLGYREVGPMSFILLDDCVLALEQSLSLLYFLEYSNCAIFWRISGVLELASLPPRNVALCSLGDKRHGRLVKIFVEWRLLARWRLCFKPS